MFCPECGAPYSSGDRFCDGCGKEFKAPPFIEQRTRSAPLPAFPATRTNKPLPVFLISTYLAVLGGLGLIASVLGETFIAVIPKEVDAMSGFMPNMPMGGSLIKGALLIELIFFTSMLSLASAYGIWNFIKWSRITTLLVLFVIFIGSIVDLFLSNSGGILISIVNIFISLAISLYLIMSKTSQQYSG
jgi:hypothetical protein